MRPFTWGCGTRSLALGLGLLVCATGAVAQTPGLGRAMLDACRGRASCAEADFYTGTLGWSELLSASGGGGGNTYTSRRTATIEVKVTSGKAWCSGSIDEVEKQWSSGKLTMDATRTGVVAGPGLIGIEFGMGGTHSEVDEDVDLDPDTPSYNITIACPTAEMTITGGGETTVTPSEPARWGSSGEFSTYDWPGDFSQGGLKGTSSWSHPDSDPLNGVSGTMSVTWSLTKGPLPAARP